jgi:low temperature requirement protein LtrA
MLERIRFRRWWRPPRTASERPEERRVTFLELFYDLVYVVIIAELSHFISVIRRAAELFRWAASTIIRTF